MHLGIGNLGSNHAGYLMVVAASAMVAVGCGGDRSPEPSAVPLSRAPVPPPLPLSRFDVPLDYDLTPVLRMVERAVPRTFGSLDSVKREDGRRSYAYVVTRGRFTGFVRGGEVHLRSTFTYAARGFYKPPLSPTLSAGCGGETSGPRLAVELATPLTLTDEWRLSPRARIIRVAPFSDTDRDKCTVSLINYDITQRVVSAARSAIQEKLPEINRRVSQVKLEDRFSRWWELLNRPIRLTDGVWLVLEPEQLRLGGVSGSGSILTVQAGIDARPRVIASVRQPTVRATELPPLARGTSSEGFQIYVEGRIGYAAASQQLTERLTGMNITRAGRSITIQTVVATPSPGGRLRLAVGFTGDASGTLQFTGIPRYDAAKREISVPDLDYEIETDSRLVSAYVWLRTDELRDVFRSRAQLSADPALERGRSLLLAGLNRKLGDVLTLSATVDSVAVRGVYVTPEGVLVRALAMGDASVQVRQE